jgi:hypothetical protein
MTMNRRIFVVAGWAVVLLAVHGFTQSGWAQSAAAPHEYVEPASVPAAIALHPGQVTVARVHALGYQVYLCGTVNKAAAWMLSGPDANLFDAKQVLIGIHFPTDGSPTWRLNDGSEIVGKKVAAAPAPDASAVAWLLLSVASHGSKTGILSDVTTIQRVNTSGGQPPATGCDAASLGVIVKSPYSADYFFSK